MIDVFELQIPAAYDIANNDFWYEKLLNPFPPKIIIIQRQQIKIN